MSVNSVGGPSQSPITMLDNYEKVSAELGGDTGAQIAALMLVSSHDQRESLGKARQATERQLEAEENKQVQSMREQADAAEKAGILNGIGKIISAGGGIAGAGMNMGVDPQEAAAGMLESSGAATGQVVGMIGNEYTHDAGEKGADATEAGNHADASKRTLDDIHDNDKDARDLARKALDMVENLRETQADMKRAALFQRV